MKNARVIAVLGLAAALVATSATLALPKDKKVNSGPSVGPPTAVPADQGKAPGKDEKKETVGPKIGAPAPAFTLKDTSGKAVSLSDYKGKIVVLEWMNPQCPICAGKVKKGEVGKMIADARAIDKDVVFLFINSTAATADDPASSREYLTSNKIEEVALIDGDGTVGRAYNARTTPHCFVIDANGVLVYDGAIDDKGSTNHVVNAVKALKEGKPVTPATTTPYGCSVKYGKPKAG